MRGQSRARFKVGPLGSDPVPVTTNPHQIFGTPTRVTELEMKGVKYKVLRSCLNDVAPERTRQGVVGEVVR